MFITVRTFLVALLVKNLPAMQETTCNAENMVQSLGWEDSLEKGMAAVEAVCLFTKSYLTLLQPYGL